MEIAFISSNKIYLEIEKKRYFLSKILTKTEKPSKFIAAMLIGEQYSLGILWLFMGFTDESDRFVRISFFLTFEFAHSDSLVYLIVFDSRFCQSFFKFMPMV
jgi:hypothetical protein